MKIPTSYSLDFWSNFWGSVHHDCSLLFDDDGRVYIAYGNSQIYLTELNDDLGAPKPNGLHRLVLKDDDNIPLGHEGCHIYKLFGKYYIFTIHAADKNRFMRTQTCYMAESLTDEFIGHDILNDDMNYFGNGVAQGGVVATPEGDWYLFVFQDRGAVGRIPVIVPMHWENDYPVINGNKIPENLSIKSTRPLYTYSPLVESDNFINSEIKKCWQWNHNPHKNLWRIKDGILYITTDKISINVTKARNILTQRAMFPQSGAEVTVDASALNDGDFAGLAIMQSNYAMVGIEKCSGKYYIVMLSKKPITNAAMYCHGITNDTEPPVIYERVPISSPTVTVGVNCDFTDMKDTARFYYKSGDVCGKIGVTHKLWFWLDHFTGARFALAVYSIKVPSGTAGFSKFVYNRH